MIGDILFGVVIVSAISSGWFALMAKNEFSGRQDHFGFWLFSTEGFSRKGLRYKSISNWFGLVAVLSMIFAIAFG